MMLPASTGEPSSIAAPSQTPARSARIGEKVFMISIRPTVSPGLTDPPASTKGGAPGYGAAMGGAGVRINKALFVSMIIGGGILTFLFSLLASGSHTSEMAAA